MAFKSVTAGQSLQTAYDQAQYGDTLSLEAGATFGQFRVTPKSGSGKIVIQSSRVSEIPPDKLVDPSQSGLMPKILGPNPEPAIEAMDGSHDVDFLGIEAHPTNELGADVYDILAGGLNSQTLDAIPKRFLFDRCYIHGLLKLHTKNGLNINIADVTVKNTYVSEIHGLGQESHAIAWFNTPGPIKINNCYLEAAGIGILSGGAQPRITGLIPSDIEIVNSYLPKKLSWMIGHPEYAGIPWNVKNPLELKSARRVRIEGNTLENCWTMGQVGMALNLNSSTEDSGLWNAVEDILVRQNRFLKMANGFVIAGGDKLNSPGTTVKLKRVTIEDNFLECGFWGGEGKIMQLGQGSEDLTFDHNTFVGWNFLILDAEPAVLHHRLKFLNNLATHGLYGLFGNGGFFGTAALDKFARDWRFQKNALYGDRSQGRPPEQYPPDNYFIDTLEQAKSLLGTDGQPVGTRLISVPSPPTTPPSPPIPALPTATITSPTAGAKLSGVVKVTADITGEIAEAYLIVDELVRGSSSTSPYSFGIDTTKLTDGEHLMYVRAWDKNGKNADSPKVTFIVANAVPVPPQPPTEPVPPIPPTPPAKPEYTTKTYNKTSAGRTALYKQMYTEGYAAWEDVDARTIRFRLFLK